MTQDDTKMAPEQQEREVDAEIVEDSATITDLTADFYRGEIDRTTTWRSRLDQTTNWAVVLVAAILTWAFSSADNPHYVILIGVFAVTAFLVMEATRYREYDVWRRRVRLVQTDLLVPMYDSDRTPDGDWQAELSDDLQNPAFGLSFRQALTHRLRRSYLALLLILLAAWFTRITVYEADSPWYETASILGIPGEIVVAVVGSFYVFVVALTAWSARDSRVQEFQE